MAMYEFVYLYYIHSLNMLKQIYIFQLTLHELPK